MFTYLFGGAMSGSTGEYLQFILPGILVQSVLFTSVYSGVALNTDMTKGVVDRFRSLPIWRPAPLLGSMLGDTVRYVLAGSLLSLVHHTDRLVGPNAQMADLAHFVHHQRRDRFDVLRSQPLVLAADQRMTPADVEAIHGVASRYYRLIIMDSGNDESDPIWQEMIFSPGATRSGLRRPSPVGPLDEK